MQTGVRIDYKTLRTVNPETARLAGLEYLDSCGHNVAETARTFGLTRASVYALERKRQSGSLAVWYQGQCLATSLAPPTAPVLRAPSATRVTPTPGLTPSRPAATHP